MATRNHNHHLHNNASNLESPVDKLEFSTTQIVIETILLLLKFIVFPLVAILKLFIPVTEKSVKGEIAVITGAGHGIGRELAYQYASKGATVVCLDINQNGNEETVKEIARLGYPKAYGYVCDVVNRENVFAVAKQIEREVGDVSILINNAGILIAAKFLDSSPEVIQRMLNVNTVAHFWTIQAFLPRMLELNRGHIVALSSGCGLVGVKYLVGYCASKFAVRGMMESLCQELRQIPDCNIKLSTIYPHIVDTGLCKKPVIRLPLITPMVKPIEAAEHIMWAQRCNVRESTIPSILFGANLFTRLFPAAVGDALQDFLNIYVKPDS